MLKQVLILVLITNVTLLELGLSNTVAKDKQIYWKSNIPEIAWAFSCDFARFDSTSNTSQNFRPIQSENCDKSCLQLNNCT